MDYYENNELIRLQELERRVETFKTTAERLLSEIDRMFDFFADLKTFKKQSKTSFQFLGLNFKISVESIIANGRINDGKLNIILLDQSNSEVENGKIMVSYDFDYLGNVAFPGNGSKNNSPADMGLNLMNHLTSAIEEDKVPFPLI